MIQVHATKKLIAKLPVDESGYLPSSSDLPASGNETLNSHESLLTGWHANLLMIQRRQCVLFVHDATRFAVFIPILTKPDFAKLDYWFQDVLVNTLLKAGVDADVLEKTIAELQPLCFDSNTDRSVQGTMRVMSGDLEHMIMCDGTAIEDVLPYSTSLWLSDRPCTVKGMKDCIWPLKALPELLKQGELKSPLLARLEESTTADVIQLNDYR